MVKAPKYQNLQSRWFLTGLLWYDAQVFSCRPASRPHMDTQPLRIFCRALHVTLGCFYIIIISSSTGADCTCGPHWQIVFRDQAKLTLQLKPSSPLYWTREFMSLGEFNLQSAIQPSMLKSSSCLCIALGVTFGHHGASASTWRKRTWVLWLRFSKTIIEMIYIYIYIYCNSRD